MTRQPRPWRKLKRVAAPAGHGSVAINAPRVAGPLTPAQYGRQVEARAAAAFVRAGYTVTRSHLSRGKADFIAIGADTVQVQVKSASTPARVAYAVQACAKDIEGMPNSARRVGCIYLYGRGEVARIELTADGWSATGTQREAARAALVRRRSA